MELYEYNLSRLVLWKTSYKNVMSSFSEIALLLDKDLVLRTIETNCNDEINLLCSIFAQNHNCHLPNDETALENILLWNVEAVSTGNKDPLQALSEIKKFYVLSNPESTTYDVYHGEHYLMQFFLGAFLELIELIDRFKNETLVSLYNQELDNAYISRIVKELASECVTVFKNN